MILAPYAADNVIMDTHYNTLGVIETAEPEVIRGAYKHLSQKYHPDKYAGERKKAEQIMMDINHAHDVLSDPDLRREYDEELASHRAKKQRNSGSQAQKNSRPHKADSQQSRAEPSTPGSEPKVWRGGLIFLVIVIFALYWVFQPKTDQQLLEDIEINKAKIQIFSENIVKQNTTLRNLKKEQSVLETIFNDTYEVDELQKQIQKNANMIDRLEQENVNINTKLQKRKLDQELEKAHP